MSEPSINAACRMFCRQCGYALVGLPSNRCPECGREFDPGNPKTFLVHPRRSVLRRIIKIVLVLACLSLPLDGYVGYLAWQVHLEEKAIEILRANGAYVGIFYDTRPSWVKFVFDGHAAWLWKRTAMIELQSTNVAPSIAVMANLKFLDSLDLHGNDPWAPMAITDRDLVQINNLRVLQFLDLSHTQVTVAAKGQLSTLTALQILKLRNTQLTDAGLAQLQGLTALKHLDLGYDKQITDDGLTNLKNLVALEYLDLCHTQISDAGLTHLNGLPSLECLDLDNTKVTDDGLRNLYGIKTLSRIFLSETGVTDAGVAALNSALPKCDIVH